MVNNIGIRYGSKELIETLRKPLTNDAPPNDDKRKKKEMGKSKKNIHNYVMIWKKIFWFYQKFLNINLNKIIQNSLTIRMWFVFRRPFKYLAGAVNMWLLLGFVYFVKIWLIFQTWKNTMQTVFCLFHSFVFFMFIHVLMWKSLCT